jgi:hypothetical protein
MYGENTSWRPTRTQLGVATLTVLEGVFVCLVGLRQAATLVLPVALALWVFIVMGIVAFNFIRRLLR